MNVNRTALIGLTVFVGLNAIGGGVGLILTNGLGMPLADLQGTPFSSYVIPGYILAIAVGGSNLLAAWALLTRHAYAAQMAFAAGAVLTGWVTVQIAMLGLVSFLQVAMFALGVVTVAFALRYLADEPSFA
jgi:hypothetical protein